MPLSVQECPRSAQMVCGLLYRSWSDVYALRPRTVIAGHRLVALGLADLRESEGCADRLERSHRLPGLRSIGPEGRRVQRTNI